MSDCCDSHPFGYPDAWTPGSVGECVLTRIDDGPIWVDRADPRILITVDLLRDIQAAQIRDDTWASLVDGVLTINGANRKVIYRLVGYDARSNCHYAEWPD